MQLSAVHSCEVADCTTKPSFAPPGSLAPLRCKAHRVTGDVDGVTKKCGVGGCQKVPSFAPPGAVKGSFEKRCKVHAPPGWTHGGKPPAPPSAAMARHGVKLRLPRGPPAMRAAGALLPFLLRCV